MESGRRKLVGVNHLVADEPKRELEIWRLADDMETQQIAKLAALRARRDQAAVDAALAAVREAARSGTNLVDPCLVAVKALATHGEICNAMRDVFGEHHPDSQTAGV
jgi:methylmalonyl-CoA mutase N-terminal domain/subunit